MDKVSQTKINQLRAQDRLKCNVCFSRDIKATYQEGLGTTIECLTCEVIHTEFL